MKLYPALTSITDGLWREKIKEIDALGIQELALFPTCLNFDQRHELYALLEKTKLKKIPIVHLREQDMGGEEIDYLTGRFGVEVFNIHPREVILQSDYLHGYHERIYVENSYGFFDEKYLQGFAGICLDFSHLESDRRLKPDFYNQIVSLTEKYPIGFAHISPVKEGAYLNPGDSANKPEMRCDAHLVENPAQFDYLKKYPAKFFPPLAAIEVENSLKEQLTFKEYIGNLLKDIV